MVDVRCCCDERQHLITLPYLATYCTISTSMYIPHSSSNTHHRKRLSCEWVCGTDNQHPWMQEWPREVARCHPLCTLSSRSPTKLTQTLGHSSAMPTKTNLFGKRLIVSFLWVKMTLEECKLDCTYESTTNSFAWFRGCHQKMKAGQRNEIFGPGHAMIKAFKY
jgi:hypothetical protein